ncbi:inorganic diphosphatase [Geodermatophilus sp. TF02-6]|uniref:inorganic diphosphatase n=1 Tax=Geodermatophilus sp. TF02-6 TaxID=2250575 RepID=UPI000DEA4B84|nr:inorganic diphosphatase [Geodermatophilus sp. TF02-6]RBY79765.1 inorganic diphosphatase [Geodermatophilus sp. TF02-6]
MSESDRLDVVVETPRGSRNKYEFDDERGVVRLDRRILGAVAFPADYGFVPETQGEDGEPLDALVLLDEPTFPGVWVASRVIGVAWIGTSTGREAKLLCVPLGEPAYEDVTDLAELPGHVAREIGHFFAVYKQLDDGTTTTDEGQDGREVAVRVLAEARARHGRS